MPKEYFIDMELQVVLKPVPMLMFYLTLSFEEDTQILD